VAVGDPARIYPPGQARADPGRLSDARRTQLVPRWLSQVRWPTV